MQHFRVHPDHARHRARAWLLRRLVLITAVASIGVGGLGTVATAGTAPHKHAKHSMHSMLKQVNAILTRYSHPTHFKAPGGAIHARKVRGKTIFFLTPTTELPFVKELIGGVEAGAAAAGLHVTVGDSQNQTTEAVRLINQAVSDKVGVIVLFGIDPSTMVSALESAKAAKIPIVLGFYGDPSVPKGPLFKRLGVVANSTYCYSCAAALVADYAIATTKGHVHAMMTWDPSTQSSTALKRGFHRELAKRCPKTCTADYVDTPASDAFQLTTTAAQAAVQNPATNFIFPQYDGYIEAVLPAISSANAGNRVAVGSDNADLTQMQEMAAGTPVKVDIGSPIAWSGWAVVDQSLRAMLHVKPAKNENLPLRVFDAANVHRFNLHADEETWYGKINYRGSYEKLWGLKK